MKSGSTITVHEFNLHQNYPNPFNPTTTISFELPKESFTEIRIYNLAGQLVQTLVNEVKPAGRHQITWDAGNLPSGIYFYQIKVENHAGSGIQTKKCVLLK
ncbi:MAG: T9SS type A sorting domain-containing protein [Candidatus Marinimicrobia bacterium]|nr:T9SS type A sorting domain-containing protein [Candidatus Neomarinimicrobiota bacterium]